MRVVVIGFGVYLLLAGGGVADTVMQCSFPASRLRWVDGEVAFLLADGANEATIDSPYVKPFTGQNALAKVILKDPKMLALSWSVKVKNKANQYTTMRYRLRTPPTGGKAEYSADPMSYDNSFRNVGLCKRVK